MGRACLLLGTLLALLFAGTFALYRPWEPAGPELLGGAGDFDEPASLSAFSAAPGARWQDGTALLPPGGRLVLRLPRPGRYDLLAARGRLASRGLQPGERAWRRGRLVLVFLDASGRAHWEEPHELCALEGDAGWTDCHRRAPVPPWAVEARFFAENAGRSGELWVDGLRLQGGRWKASWPWLRLGLAAAWLGALLACLLGLARRPLGTARAALALAIALGVSLPHDALRASTQAPVRAAQRLEQSARRAARPAPPASRPPPASSTSGEPRPPEGSGASRAAASALELADRARDLQKSGHALLFGLLAALGLLAWRRGGGGARGLLAGALLLALYAADTELLQLLVPGREPCPEDALLDLAGAAAGALLLAAALSLAGGRRGRAAKRGPG